MSRGDEVKAVDSGVKLTYDDYVHFPDDGKRHELIDGEHYVTPSPSHKHQAVAWNLSRMIGVYLEAHPIGRAFAAPFDVILSDVDVVEPDLLYVSRQRLTEIETSPWVRGAPNLVVEIGSPGTRKRDATVKRHLYDRFGVEEYWLIDPELETVHVYRRVEGRYARVYELTLERGDTLATPLLPGIELPLAKIFED